VLLCLIVSAVLCLPHSLAPQQLPGLAFHRSLPAINQSANQTISQSNNQPIKQSANQTISQSNNQPIKQSANQTIVSIKKTFFKRVLCQMLS
jgi:hypothetical protein